MINLKLMFCDKNFDLEDKPCYGYAALESDLELERIVDVMAGGDTVIHAVCSLALLSPLTDLKTIELRQNILKDARINSQAVRKLYDVTMSLEPVRREGWRPHSNMAIITVYRQALDILGKYTDALELLLQTVKRDGGGKFSSDELRGLYERLSGALGGKFLSELKDQIADLADTDKTLISAQLGPTLQGENYTPLRGESRASWLRWKLAPSYKANMNSMEDDEVADINNRRERVMRDIANTLYRAIKYLESFFDTLRQELAFYIGCLNLEEKLTELGMPTCIPRILPSQNRSRSYSGLYDLALTLLTEKQTVGNDLSCTDKELYIVTGANQGGKSTFLRSIGQLQLMAQCGMPAAAQSAEVPLRNGLFTHFKREEDRGMKSGKLDEELARLSEAVDHMRRDSMLLLNESFASTNEREGSEICRQITLALMESGVEIFSVSHMYVYATAFENQPGVIFLRAQRNDDGSRTFRLEEGKPLETAFGSDLYRKIIGEVPKS